jgi:hypothetical protein
LVEAEALLGDRQPTVLDTVRRQHMQAEIQKQRDLVRAREFEAQGDALREKQAYEEATQNYERAQLTLKYSPWFIPGSSEQARIEAKIKQVQEEHGNWLRTRSDQLAREARARLAAEEREARERLERRVSELLIQANLAFQSRQYAHTVTLLDEALKLDPLRRDASDMRELAMRARHDQSMDHVQREWRRQWALTFQDLRQQDVVQTDPIKHDIDYWTKNVQGRQPIEFSHFDVVEDPDTAEILKALERTSIEHKFAETPLTDWVDYYKRATDLTFLVSPKVRELGEEETTLRGFSIGKKSVRAALDLITRIKPLRWRVKDGVVHILTKDEGKDATVPRVYDVREIINPLAQHPGRDIQLSVGEGDEAEPEAEEPAPVVVDIDKLQELIRSTVAKDTWDGTEGVSIAVQGPSLIISHTAEVHAQIDKLLSDLRGQSGIQVDIESRFLRVEDNFLEEIGVDFRGLGDQASEGVPGRGLEKQGNRAGFGFDDFGRNTSASDPSVIGSGFEPGFFYDDGGDGDIFGRTEHLFDRVLGGGAEGLNNAGGMSFQWTYLDDAELEVILRAVEKQERVEQISAPRLLVHNTARAHLAVNRQFSYVRDFNVEIAQAAAVADPGGRRGQGRRHARRAAGRGRRPQVHHARAAADGGHAGAAHPHLHHVARRRPAGGHPAAASDPAEGADDDRHARWRHAAAGWHEEHAEPGDRLEGPVPQRPARHQLLLQPQGHVSRQPQDPHPAAGDGRGAAGARAADGRRPLEGLPGGRRCRRPEILGTTSGDGRLAFFPHANRR